MILAPVIVGAQDEQVAQLAKEVGGKGWIVYAARGENGTWDLFLMRPHGSEPQQIAGDREYPWASWSPDGKQIACLTMTSCR